MAPVSDVITSGKLLQVLVYRSPSTGIEWLLGLDINGRLYRARTDQIAGETPNVAWYEITQTLLTEP